MFLRFVCVCFMLVFVSGFTQVKADEQLSVVASIRPIHSLVASVLGDEGHVDLVIAGSGSPHSYSLKPSAARALQNADAIFLVGRDLETFLAKPLGELPHKARVVALNDDQSLHLLPSRENEEADDDHGGKNDDDHEHHHHGEGGADPHSWLNPQNAIIMVTKIAKTLGEIAPDKTTIFQKNAEATIRKIKRLDSELVAILTPVQNRPYAVYHDGFQYFEKRYGLTYTQAVVALSHVTPSVAQMVKLKANLKKTGTLCLFSETWMKRKVTTTLANASGAREGVLDTLGAKLEPGPDLYFALMMNLANQMSRCLTEK